MNYKRKVSWLLALAVVASLSFSCGRQGNSAGESQQDTVKVNIIDTVPTQDGPDLTLYGKGADFGMSTFSLLTSDDEEYDVTRVSMDGHEGRIFGTVAPGQRYAMMMDEKDDALISLINIDELEQFVKDYYIYNGQLVIKWEGNREWVDIETLSSTEFVAKGRGGTTFSFKK